PGTLYATGNLVFRTRDEGSSWEAISPDLTRQDVTKLEASGGPLTKDTSGAEHYGTVYAFAESPRERGVLWAGSDDGLVHVSRDAGKTWQNVTPPDLPEWSLIATIEASPHAAGSVYVAATRYKIDDNGAYLYKSEDYGQTWRNLAAGFPAGEISRVIREDPIRPGLLYVGTETRVVGSSVSGRVWHRAPGHPASRPRVRPRDQGKRPGGGAPRAVFLGAGRHPAAARAERGGHHRVPAPLPAAADGASVAELER